MIVCVCRRVSDREIARHARAGMGFDEIQFELGVATQCGRCEGCARDVVARCSADGTLACLQRSLRELGVLPVSPLPARPLLPA